MRERETVLDVVLPAELVPGWGEVPALAWLAAGRFRSRTPSWLAVVAQVSVWSSMLQVLVSARVQGQLAAYGRGAVLVVTGRPRRSQWRGIGAGVIVSLISVAVLLGPTLLVVCAAVVAASAGALGLAQALMVVAFLPFMTLAGLSIAATIPALAAGIRCEGTRTRKGVPARWPYWVEGSTFAADPADRRAATILVRRLLRLADERQIPVVVFARDDALAALYTRLGFVPVMPQSGRGLYRPPQSGVSGKNHGASSESIAP